MVKVLGLLTLIKLYVNIKKERRNILHIPTDIQFKIISFFLKTSIPRIINEEKWKM